MSEQAEAPRTRIIGGPVCTRTADHSLHVNLLPGRRPALYARLCLLPVPAHAGGAGVAAARRHRLGREERAARGSGARFDHGLRTRRAHSAPAVRARARRRPVRAAGPARAAGPDRHERHHRCASLTSADCSSSPTSAWCGSTRAATGSRGRNTRCRARRSPRRCASYPTSRSSRSSSKGPGGNTGERDVTEWIARLAELRPKHVTVTTIAEPPLDPTVPPRGGRDARADRGAAPRHRPRGHGAALIEIASPRMARS